MLFYAPPKDSSAKLEEYTKQRKIAFIAFIICCVIAFICGADTFEKVSTWVWIMMTIAAFILMLVFNSEYNEAYAECEGQKALRHDKEIHELEKEIKAISNNINRYKREAFQYEKENKELKEQVSVLESDKVRLRGEINALNERLRMQTREADNSTGRLNQYILENQKLKCEVDSLRKLLSEKERAAPVTDRSQEEQVKKVIAVEFSRISINKNVDTVLSGIIEEPVCRANPIPSKIIIVTPLQLKKRYPATPTVLNGDYTVFDIETTGLSKSNDEIIELSAVRFRAFRAERTFTTLIDPRKHIPNRITGITGITDEDVKSAPVLEEIKDSFLRFVGTDTLVGHNIRAFDLGFLHRRGFNVDDPERAYLDTLNISRRLISKDVIENHKLDTLLEYFGITRSSGHRGEIDSVATGILFAALVFLAREQNKISEIG